MFSSLPEGMGPPYHPFPRRPRTHRPWLPTPPILTISKEGVCKVETAHNTREGVVGRAGLDAALHGRHLHILGTSLLRQLRIGLLQLEGHKVGPPSCPPPHHPARLACCPTLLPATMRFFPDARLLRMRRKDWRKDFLSDFTRDSGPSMARESLGCRVHLGTQASHQGSTGPAAEGQTCPSGVLRGQQCPRRTP